MLSADYLVCVLLFASLVIVSGNWLQCGDGLIGKLGATKPDGDIYLKDGSDLTIKCMLNLSLAGGLDSNDLVFKKGNQLVPQDFVRVLNKSAIELHVERPLPSNAMYYCKLRDRNVCLNSVTVGTPPQPPEDFHCISQNWENLTCKFHPKENYVKTRYQLSFHLPETRLQKSYECVNVTEDKSNNLWSCFWNRGTLHIYRQMYNDYVLNLTMTNRFGIVTSIYNFSNYENVIPARPSYIIAQEFTPHSAVLVWNITTPMNNFSPGLNHRVQYISEFENKTWKMADTSILGTEAKSQFRFNLTDLKYAYAWYDVRIQIKSARAPNEENRWSEFTAVTFRTLSELPSQPPKTVTGSFEIINKNINRDILLYWQKTPDSTRNGPNFKYEVINVKKDGNNVSGLYEANETTSSYAKFSNLSFESEYEFTIVSSNEVGKSLNTSVIQIPKSSKVVKKPSDFTNIAFSHNMYQLLWDKSSDGISNYTLFWCKNERNRPHQCTGYLDWVTVPASTSAHNITVEDSQAIYQFAISANNEVSSSGMLWLSCTVLPNGIAKMTNVRIDTVGATYMEVSWILECSARLDGMSGFRIYYCPTPSPNDNHCQGSKQNITINDDSTKIGRIYGLQPYTTYQVNVSVITKDGKEGIPSNPLYKTTLESAPTPPLAVRLHNVTNSSMFVTWEPPEKMNGVLKNYVVSYQGEYGTFTRTVEKNLSVTLVDLYGFTNYTIMVKACTNIQCSEGSYPATTRTLISYPSKIPKPDLTIENYTLSWERPQFPGGRLDMYEVKMILSKDGEMTENEPYFASTNSFLVPDTICARDSPITYSFAVRAINIGPEPSQSQYPGPWSETLGNICQRLNSDNTLLFWIGGVFAGVLVFAVMFFACKRLRDHCRSMKDIEVKLPPGIALSNEKQPKYAFDETSLLPHNNRTISSSDDHNNTVNTSFTSKDVSDDSGVHNGSEDNSEFKWPNINHLSMNVKNKGNKIKMCDDSNDEWLSDGNEACYTKFTDNYPGKTMDYCLVGAENPAPLTNGYVQAVLPIQNKVDKPYESFECAIIKPQVNKILKDTDSTLNSPLSKPAEKINGYLPISSCLPIEPNNRMLLTPRMTNDNKVDDLMSQIKTGVKQSETSPGYVVVDSSNTDSMMGANKFHTPLLPVNVSNLQNSSIPEGYVKAAERPSNGILKNQDSPYRSLDSVLNHMNNGNVQVHSPYVAQTELNKCFKPEVTKSVLNPSINVNRPMSSGYVQHTIDKNQLT